MVEERYKAIAIPVSLADGHPRFLTVRDRRFKDWIFVAGGCRKREIQNPLKCALRELEEETRGVISLKEGEYTTFSFRTHNRTDEELRDDRMRGVKVMSVYHVFIFFVNMNEGERRRTIDMFNNEKAKMDMLKERRLPIKRTHDENDMMLWSTLDEFKRQKQWDVIKYNILNNPTFIQKLHDSRSNFNVHRNYTPHDKVSCDGQVESGCRGDGGGRPSGWHTCRVPDGIEGKGTSQVDEGSETSCGPWRTAIRGGGRRVLRSQQILGI
jgi:hypothetical protein